jgi:peptidoglycan-N-acetylglucosamine deacetylase
MPRAHILIAAVILLRASTSCTYSETRAPLATALSADKLIALTFDDGPRPYVLLGTTGEHPTPGLLDTLEKNGVKGTFFVVGWRLTPGTWGDRRYEKNVGVTCIDAAQQAVKRGHELEDHTFTHIELRGAERTKGEQWVVGDVERAARAIKAVTGIQPRYVRPPDWSISDNARLDLERHGYRVLTISAANSIALRDVNSLDYLCTSRNSTQCPKPSLASAVLKQVQQREAKGVYTHIMVFHELSTTTAIMPELIGSLNARGYRFVTLTEYMRLVTSKPASTGEIARSAVPAVLGGSQ